MALAFNNMSFRNIVTVPFRKNVISIGILENLKLIKIIISNVLYFQESDRFNRLLSVMRRSLKNLKSAIRGEVVMSSELDRMYSSLLNNEVPAMWSKVFYIVH